MPALAGVAAVVCMSQPQAFASTSAGDATAAGAAAQSAVTAQAHQHATSVAELTSATTVPAAFRRAEAVAAPRGKHAAGSAETSYTVRSGDSLSAIAGHLYSNSDAWPVLYWANHSQIKWADIIEPGQVLRVPAKPARIPAAPSSLAPASPAPAPVTSQADVERVQTPAPTDTESAQVSTGYSQPRATHSNASYTGGTPGGAFGQCVVARESGGNSQVMNASGHYGLYQFSASTWAAYGGSPADFGHASVSEQNRVFANALAAGGQSNWAPYDGC
ncbi:MAG TPA: transglycosylase family protein [Streptosporangiaceae bacterium]